jgi:hypothetical protein
MENNFYKTIYNITLCNFWYRIEAWHHTQQIQNLDTEDLWILRYSRSSFFTFLFCMPKILGNSSGKNNKSCRIFHKESSKIGFAFFWFFYDFLWIFKVSAKAIYYLRLRFTGRPLELLSLLVPGSWKTPWKEGKGRNVVLGLGGRRGSPELGGSGGALGRGMWRPRFLINVISANDRISRVKPADHGQT